MKGLFKHFQQFSKIRKIKLSKVNNDDIEDIIDGIGQQFHHMELVCIRHSALKSTKSAILGSCKSQHCLPKSLKSFLDQHNQGGS